MALQISKAALKLPLSTPGQAGQATERIFSHTFDVASGTDIIELAGLPAHMVPTGMTVVFENLAGTTTADVGFIDGIIQEPDDARAIGTEFANDHDTDNVLEVPVETLAAITKSQEHRGIGIQLNQNEAAGATKKVHVRLRYVSQ